MKLRLQSNSIRLRLKRGEIQQLATAHRVEEKIIMGVGSDHTFHYVLEASREVSAPQAHLQARGILVRIPLETVTRWADGPDVGIEAKWAAGERHQLHVLIEKDFACLNGREEENIDTFPHPHAETGC